ncbi:MAG: hypothetical protein ABI596_15940 [Pyrinomonadaceae bacterium]
MKRFFTASFPVLFISLFSMSAVAQQTNRPPPYDDFKASNFPEDRIDNRSYRRPPSWVTPEDRVINDGPLAPAKEDRQALKAFLREKNTGLMRLLSREPSHNNAQPAKEPKVKLIGGGAYYSFAHLTHLYGYGSDIELADNKFLVGFAGADYGLLLNLGDQPLEQITLDDLRVNSLASYLPPQPEREARQEYQRLGSKEGLVFETQLYRRSLPVEESMTYLLRSISYSNSDVLVAFRVVRKDDDGSVVIAWKLLKRFSPTKLIPTNRDGDRPW